jgi:hypothetical protein
LEGGGGFVAGGVVDVDGAGDGEVAGGGFVVVGCGGRGSQPAARTSSDKAHIWMTAVRGACSNFIVISSKVRRGSRLG